MPVTLHILGSTDHMIVIFGNLVQNDHISRCFFVFSEFWFSRVLGDQKSKNGPKWQKIMSVLFLISGTISNIIVVFVYQKPQSYEVSAFGSWEKE